MASLGTINGITQYSDGGLTVRANWVQTITDSSHSSLQIELQAKQTRGTYFEAACQWAVSIGGGDPDAFTGTLRASQSGSWTTCWTKSYTITHDDEGKATTSVQIGGTYHVGQWEDTAHVPVSGSETITLDPIPQGGGDTQQAASIVDVLNGPLGEQMSITIQRYGTGTSYCQAVVEAGGQQLAPITMDGVPGRQIYTFTPPASWASLVGDDAIVHGQVILTTYSDSGHTTPIGTATTQWEGYALCGIAFASESVDLGDRFNVSIGRTGRARYVGLQLSLGSASYTWYMDLDSAISSYYDVPIGWGSQFASATSKTGTLKVTTYTSADHSLVLGWAEQQWTCKAPSTLGPSASRYVMWVEGGKYSTSTGAESADSTRLRTGFVPYNAGTSQYQTSARLSSNSSGWYFTPTQFNLDGTVAESGSLTAIGNTFGIRGNRKHRFLLQYGSAGTAAVKPEDLCDPSGVYKGLNFGTSGGSASFAGWAIAYPRSTNATVNAWGVAVAGYSDLHISVDARWDPNHPTNAPLRINRASGATISAVYASVAGKTYTLTPSGGTYSTIYSADTDVIPASVYGETEVKVWVVDSRGYTCEASYKPMVYSYSAPRLTDAEVFRCDQYGVADELSGEYASIKATISTSSVGGNNTTATLEYRYAHSGGSWSNWAALTSGTASVVSGFDADKAYTVEIRATDGLRSTTHPVIVPSALVLIHAPIGGKRLGIGQYFDSALGDEWIDSKFALRLGGTLAFADPTDMPYLNLTAAGTEIESGSDLSDADFLAVGNYYCGTNAAAATLSNQPTSLSAAFVMRTYCTCGPSLARWRIQEIVSWDGSAVWRRYVDVKADGTLNAAGSWYKFTGVTD